MTVLAIAVGVLLLILIALASCNAAAKADEELERMARSFVIAPEPTPEPTMKPWVRYPVPMTDELQRYVVDVCLEYNVAPCIVFAVMGVETHGTYDPSLIGDNGNSFGLMQIYRFWHEARMERLGVTDLLDPYQNVLVGIDLLAELLDIYDLDGALNYYNSGSTTGAPGYAYTVQRNAECILEGAMVVAE